MLLKQHLCYVPSSQASWGWKKYFGNNVQISGCGKGNRSIILTNALHCRVQELVAASCATSTAVYMDPGTTVGTLGVWQVVPRPTTNQYFPNGQYNVTVPARIGRGCNGILNAVPCTAGAAVNLDGGNLGEPDILHTSQ